MKTFKILPDYFVRLFLLSRSNRVPKTTIMICRQRLLSTDVLPSNSSDHTTTTTATHHFQHHNYLSQRRLEPNHVDAWTQTSSDMVTINNTTDFPIQQHQSTLWNQDYSRPCCIPTTVTPPHVQLQSILPIFPELNEFDEFYPLLTNIPNERLSTEESIRRITGNYTDLTNQYTSYTNNNELYQAIQSRIIYFSHCWNVDRAILIVNINRLFAVLHQLTFKSFVEERQQQKLYEFTIEEWFMILEYYLQMDVECFFMKTNPFRHGRLDLSIQEHLFCLTSPPESQYGMKQCHDKKCRFCYEPLNLIHRFEPAMNFSTKQIHRFINTYSVYLNCDVTCTTSNVIYALTCPCHQYDYIGQCSISFRDRMTQHRIDGYRIISHFLLGQVVTDGLQSERRRRRPADERIVENIHVKLYQHSIQCPIALRIFLKCYPIYWCLVPMTMEHAMIDDTDVTSGEASLLTHHPSEQDAEEEEENQQQQQATSKYYRSPRLIHWCIDHLPKPPRNYRFSMRQRIEQFVFFRDCIDVYPSHILDLYNAAMIVAMPEQCSDDVRLVIQALLLAYAEPKLNVMTTDSIDSSLYFHGNNVCWCQDLIHPRIIDVRFQNESNM